MSTCAARSASADLELFTCSIPVWISVTKRDPCSGLREPFVNRFMSSSTRRAAGSRLSRSTRSSLKCPSASRAFVRLARSERRWARISPDADRDKLELFATTLLITDRNVSASVNARTGDARYSNPSMYGIEQTHRWSGESLSRQVRQWHTRSLIRASCEATARTEPAGSLGGPVQITTIAIARRERSAQAGAHHVS